MASILQGSFTSGELSPNLYSRVDLERWKSSLKLCRNWIVKPYGGLIKRPGTVTVANAKAQCRLVPFRSSTNVNYVLEFSNNCIRLFLNGGQVYSAGTTPLEITTTYTTAQLADLKFSQSVDVLTITHPSHAPANLSRVSSLVWTLANISFTQGPFLDLNLDGAAAIYASVARGVATLTATKGVFTSDYNNRLLYLESKTFGTPWEVGITVAAGDIRRSDGKYYKALNAGITGTLRPSHFVDTWSDGTINWEYQHQGYGVAKITAVATLTATATVLSLLPESLVCTGFESLATITAAATLSATTGQTILAVATHTFTDAANTGVAKATYSDASTGAVVVKSFPSDTSILIHTAYTDYVASGLTITGIEVHKGTETSQPTDRWSIGAWGGSRGYPAVSTYYQGRKVYAASTLEPQTVWMSRSNSYNDFGFSIPMQDDDPITFTMASPRYDTITAFSVIDRLLVFTTGGEWAVGAGLAEILTPSTVSMHPLSSWGSNSVEPIPVGDVAFFIQPKGGVVRTISAEGKSVNTTVLADHLFDGKSITAMAYQQTPHGILWCIRNDGVLLGLTYMREQEVAGWHQHTTTSGTYESVCVVTETISSVLYEVAYFSVLRGSTRTIERMVLKPSGNTYVDNVSTAVVSDFQTLDIEAGTETLVNKKKAIRSVVLQVLDSNALYAGRDSSHLSAVPLTALATLTASGVAKVDISTPWGVGGSVWVRQSSAYGANITSIIPEVEIGGML